MNEQALLTPVTEEDAAWAAINTPLSADVLRTFCQQDIERLFRINPMLEFKSWKALGNERYLFSARNISQDPPFEFETEATVSQTADGLRVEYSCGLKSSTEFCIEESELGSRLTITDKYEGLAEQDRQAHLGEVDKSIVVWADYLQKFLMDWNKWSRFAPWRWYMRYIWQPMKPSARRITYMLLWISVVEIALIMLGVGIYFAEYA